MESQSTDQQLDRDILCFRTYDEWRNYLQNFEIATGNHYIITAETKGFSKEVIMADIIRENPAPKLRWEFNASNSLWPIPYTGSPYIHLGMQEYHCHQGKDLNLKRKEQRKLSMEEDRLKKRRKVNQPTKKQDCPIKFVVKKIFRFLNYNLEKDSRRSRKKMLDTIRLNEFTSAIVGDGEGSIDTLNNANIVQYLVVMPTENHHHLKGKYVGSTAYRLDNRVKEFIITQIQQGCTRPKDIEIKVEEFVKENIFHGGSVPVEYRDMFFPGRKKISNIKIAVNKCSRILQENLENLVEDWTRLTNGELLNSDALDEVEEPLDHIHPAGISIDDCCYFTVDKLNVSNETIVEHKDVGEKRIKVRTTLQQFLDITNEINDFKILDDLDNALMAYMGKLKKSIEA